MDKLSELKQFLMEHINVDLIRIVISGTRGKTEPQRVKIRPVAMKEEIIFQASVEEGNKVFHENLSKEQVIARILSWMYTDFRQLQLESRHVIGSALVSKKGKVTLKVKKQSVNKTVDLSHNRKKQYIIEEGIAVPFLIDLGVMTQEGKIVKSRYDKFRQINRFLEFIEDILPNLPQGKEITILDFGCGKSYLTFAMYYYLKVMRSYDIRIIGLDLKADVIDTCNRLSQTYGYDKLDFYVGDIASYTGQTDVDMVVSLHACDTATDYALAKAVFYQARVIFCVPCCQHELNGQITCPELESVLKYGLLKERMASLITDGLRANLLEESGYAVQILEFIDMEHTPKNILIRAVKSSGKGDNCRREELTECLKLLNVRPTLQKLL